MNEEILPPGSVAEGIRAILHDDKVEIIPVYDTRILLTSFELRKTINDFIDCLIFSSAVNHCDVLVTEDDEIHNLTKNNRIHRLITAANPDFKIKRINEFA